MDKTFKIAVILSAYDKMSTVVNSASSKMQAKLKGLQSGLMLGGLGSALGGGAITAFFSNTVKAAEENEIAVNRLNQVYRSMGQDVSDASKKSQDYASKLEMQIGVEDEAIMAVQAKLATFSKVSDKIARDSGLMNRATAAAYDLQATGFGEASQNATILGKALQDPARGAMALARAGALNKGDLPIIKQIQATKGLAAAQEYVMKAVEKQVKGVAESTAPASQKMKVAWSEVTESIGKSLLPTVKSFTSYLTTKIIPAVQAFTEKHPKLIKVLAGVAAALGIVGIASMALSAILAINPIVLIITAIAGAALLIYSNWGPIKAWFGRLWDNVTAIFKRVFKILKALFFDFTPVGLIYNNWGPISQWFGNLWDKVKEKFNVFMNWVTGFPERMWNAGVQIVERLWAGIKSKWAEFQVWMEDKMSWMDDIAQYFDPQTANRVKIRELTKVLETQTSQPKSNISPSGTLQPALSPVGARQSNSVFQFSPTINYTGNGSQQDAQLLTGMIKDDFAEQMRKYQENKTRKSF